MIVFDGIDIVVDRELGPDGLRRGIADVLSVPPGRVSVILDVAEYPERGDADVVCIVTGTSGQFATVISIQCDPIELPFSDFLEVAQCLSAAFEVTMLAPGDGPDPYTMWLVQPHAPRKKVGLVEAALQDDRYEIRGARGLVSSP